MSSAEAPGIEVRGLTVSAGRQVLLEDADADFGPGRITLVVGASGAGKTVLVKLLAGLREKGAIRARGSVRVGGREMLARGGSRTGIGLVFQDFALFDELTARGNIDFAADHRRGRRSSRSDLSAEALLREFHIPAATPVRHLSGGQKQRLAVARTLAHDPPVIVYDEPTSGLDPNNAARVAARIRDTARSHGKTTIVVTHDYAHLAGIADDVYLLDPSTRKLVRLGESGAEELARFLPSVRDESEAEGAEVAGGTEDAGAAAGAEDAEGEEDAAPRPRRRPLRRLVEGCGRVVDATGGVVEGAITAAWRLLPLGRRWRWGLRYLLHYLGQVASLSSILYFACAGLISGFVSTYFTFEFLPYRSYSEPLLADEILRALGFIVYRVVVPVLVTVLLAARCGAAIAADIGTRSYSRQFDAMRTFGVRPSSYLLTNVLYAFLLATPLLIAVAFVAARVTSLVVFVFTHPQEGAEFWDGNFHRDLRVAGEMFYHGSGWLLAKVLACGAGVGAISYHIGARPKVSGVEVSRGITTAIIWGTLYVLLVHSLFAFLEFEPVGWEE